MIISGKKIYLKALICSDAQSQRLTPSQIYIAESLIFSALQRINFLFKKILLVQHKERF
jgi:hypothetical protein